jgi:hypothetical protein
MNIRIISVLAVLMLSTNTASAEIVTGKIVGMRVGNDLRKFMEGLYRRTFFSCA